MPGNGEARAVDQGYMNCIARFIVAIFVSFDHYRVFQCLLSYVIALGVSAPMLLFRDIC